MRERKGCLLGFWGFLYLRFLSGLFLLEKKVGASAEWGGNFMGGPLLTSTRSWERDAQFFSLFRIFFHLVSPFLILVSLHLCPSFLEVFVMSFGTGSVVAGLSTHPHASVFTPRYFRLVVIVTAEFYSLKIDIQWVRQCKIALVWYLCHPVCVSVSWAQIPSIRLRMKNVNRSCRQVQLIMST